MILPIHDSGKHGADADYELFSPEERTLWDIQLRSTLVHQLATVKVPETPPTSPTHVTYNVVGTNARVNIDSRDSSVNVANDISPAVFEQLASAIRPSAADASEKKKLEMAVEEMRTSHGTSGFGSRYCAFISLLADHMQVFGPIVAPYLPILAQLVT